MLQPKTADGPVVLADHLVPDSTLVLDGALVVAMSLVIALCAQVSIPLPFTPVPLTGQTLGVLYAGALLGPRRGAAASALYLMMGAAGLPFLAGGAAGLAHFAGATSGYLLGFIPAAYLTGELARRGWDRSPLTAFAAMLLGSSIIFALGCLVLRFFVPAGEVLPKGLYPFLIGDCFKAAVSAGLLPLGWKLIGKK
jgi:biotin transport system substrate-specific component